MDIVHKSNVISRLTSIVFSLLFLFTVSLLAQDADPANGQKLFNSTCASCHKLDTKFVGPPLKGVTDKRSKEWLKQFIVNSTEFIKKDADAKAIFDEYKIPMPAHPQFSDKDLEDIIAYLAVGDEGIAPPVAEVDNAKPDETADATQPAMEIEAGKLNWWWQPVVLLVLGGLIYFFAKKKSNLIAIFLTIIWLFSAAYFMFAWLLQIGVDTGYKPIQSIEFSHKVHAGDNGIDCEYCHSSAKHSKTSGIPSVNVCMNCHKSITEYKGELYGNHDKKFFDGEIAKVHEAAGWSPKDFAYTSEGKPIEWTRVHNLADFVYYNHSQHVNVAGLECQTCHGPVENMHRVEQFSPLTMDWCISCHKESKVQLEENAYYSETYNDDFKELHKGATVADMGGRECGKCHY
jgi:cytochrome c551/c552